MSDRPFLTVCAIVKDELDLPEWVAYHFAVGAEKIHIYDNESAIPVEHTLRNWIKDDKVTVVRVGGKGKQMPVYNMYLKSTNSLWTAFIDADEFVLPHQGNDIKTVLDKFFNRGGLHVEWRRFGSNGHTVRPQKLVLEAYTKTGLNKKRKHEKTKAIVQPAKARAFKKTIHYPEYCHGKNNKAIIPSVKQIQINHYLTKSRADFVLKMKKGGGNDPRYDRTEEDWRNHEQMFNAFDDFRIQRFIPMVKELMDRYS